MASEQRPGVIVTQALSETTAVTASPSLVPLVMAPCFQIIEAVKSDGSTNSVAKHSTKYSQVAMNITQAEFPDPRSNIDELEIYEDKVHVQLFKGSSLEKLQRGSNSTTGSSFLARIKGIYRAAVKFNCTGFIASTFASEKRLVMAIDATNPTDTTKDLVYKFDATVTTIDDIVSTINTKYGSTIAYKDGTAVVVFSPSYGPASSITIRGGSSATASLSNTSNHITNDAVDNRVEGAGLFAQDDEDNDLTSPFIAYSRGQVLQSDGVNGGTFSIVSENWGGYVSNPESGLPSFTAGQAADVTFGGSSPSIPLKAATRSTPGDYLVADAVRAQSSEVILVEERRFKLGKINSASSTYSSTTGDLVTRVYDTLEFNLVESSSPFSPECAYFIAQNLVIGEVLPAGAAATVTSTPHANYIASRLAQVSGDVSGYGSSQAMTGLTLIIQETIDGVQQSDVTVTFAGTLAIAAVATAITDDATLSCAAAVKGDYLVISSSKAGDDQIITVKSTGTANTVLGFSASAATTASGKDIEIAERATLTGFDIDGNNGTPADTTALTGSDNIQLTITDSNGTHTLSQTTAAAGSGYANMDTLAIAIATAFGGGSGDLFVYSEGIKVASISVSNGSTNSGAITFTTIEGGASVQLSSIVAVGVLGIKDDDDDGADLLNGSVLKFSLDENPTVFETLFEANSISAAVDQINTKIGGDVDIASMDSSTGAFTITSAVLGTSSAVEVDASGAQDATILNMSSSAVSGSGRPNPDFYVDPSTNAVILGANQIRNTETGIPYSVDSTSSDIYIEYTALRKDVTASASEPGIITFGSITELEASIGPISTDNPLGLAAYLCMLNSPSATISCLGIDETNNSAPLGTVDGYLRALEMLESKEVYSLAPITDDIYIQQLISTHVKTLSTPAERGERIALLWSSTPDRANDTSIEGGSGDAAQNGTDNQMTLAANHSSAVISAGITGLSSISVDKGLYLEVTTVALGSTQVHNYSVSKIDGLTATLNVSFSSDENDDGFYSTTTFSGSSSFSSISYALRIRGDKLLITGTTLPDVSAITATAAAQAGTFEHRRVFLLFGDSVDVSIDGVTTNIPGYYIAPGIAGMVGAQPPQQPFTNVVMTGYGKVYGTDDTYSENQLDVIADGGRYVLKNLAGGISARHQRSTSNITIEARELSITKAIDFLAKGMREVNRVFIGKYVITPGFLDQLTMANEGYLRRVVQVGVVRTSNLKSLLQSETEPDTVLIEVEVQPAFPCNKIRITIVS